MAHGRATKGATTPSTQCQPPYLDNVCISVSPGWGPHCRCFAALDIIKIASMASAGHGLRLGCMLPPLPLPLSWVPQQQ